MREVVGVLSLSAQLTFRPNGTGLSGRTAIVCGASSGMGLASAEALAAEGANVAMFARRRELLEREADRLGALAVRGDLTNPEHLRRLVETTVSAFGDGRRARSQLGRAATEDAADVTDADVEEAVELLCSPPRGSSRCAFPSCGRAATARIVAITSSSVREPIPGLALSNAVRPGLVGWLKTLARESAPTA